MANIFSRDLLLSCRCVANRQPDLGTTTRWWMVSSRLIYSTRSPRRLRRDILRALAHAGVITHTRNDVMNGCWGRQDRIADHTCVKRDSGPEVPSKVGCSTYASALKAALVANTGNFADYACSWSRDNLRLGASHRCRDLSPLPPLSGGSHPSAVRDVVNAALAGLNFLNGGMKAPSSYNHHPTAAQQKVQAHVLRCCSRQLERCHNDSATLFDPKFDRWQHFEPSDTNSKVTMRAEAVDLSPSASTCDATSLLSEELRKSVFGEGRLCLRRLPTRILQRSPNGTFTSMSGFFPRKSA